MTDLSEHKTCCTPVRGVADQSLAQQGGVLKTSARAFSFAQIPGGTAHLGTAQAQIPDDGETPFRSKKIKPFRMAETTVTNAEFATFVEDTGYVTEAERYGWSFVFWTDIPGTVEATQGVQGVEWWRRVDGADWRNVNGPRTPQDAILPDHPVVQVSARDAAEYARWAGGRLPTEAEWEHAARGGQGDVRFAWGDAEPDDHTQFPCNIWQGQFPNMNTGADGWKTTAPAKSYAPNAFGLYNMCGNVWEWTSDVYTVKSLKKHVRARLKGMRGFRVLKGGSFLCHRSYCYRYRIAARSGNSPDSTTTHQGFRMVWDERSEL